MQCCQTSAKVVGRAEKFFSTPMAEMCHCIMVVGRQMEKLLTVQKSLEREEESQRGFVMMF